MVYQVRWPFIDVVKYDGVINGGTVTPHASFNFVVAHHCKMVEGGPWCECMYCLPTRRKTRVWKGIVGIRELTEQQSCGIRKNAKYAGFDHCSGSKIHRNLGTGCDTKKENDFRDGDDRSSGCGNPTGLS